VKEEIVIEVGIILVFTLFIVSSYSFFSTFSSVFCFKNLKSVCHLIVHISFFLEGSI